MSHCQCRALLVLLLLIVTCTGGARGGASGIQCYSCDSHVDPTCKVPLHNEWSVMNCSTFISLKPDQLRCVRIVSNTDPRKEVVIRRCAVVGDCKYIAKNEFQSCHECNEDKCNDGK